MDRDDFPSGVDVEVVSEEEALVCGEVVIDGEAGLEEEAGVYRDGEDLENDKKMTKYYVNFIRHQARKKIQRKLQNKKG